MGRLEVVTNKAKEVAETAEAMRVALEESKDELNK